MEERDTSFLVDFSIILYADSLVSVDHFNESCSIDELIDLINSRVTSDAIDSLEYTDCVEIDQSQVKEVAREIWEYFQEKKALKEAKEKQGVLFE